MMKIQGDQSGLIRKGIYQTFDTAGNVVADERWRAKVTLDGGLRIDTDTVRIAPFIEARNESISFELGPDLMPRRVIIHALGDRRESRVDIAPPRANVCWRLDDVSKTHEFRWTKDCEIGYNSPLFDMATLWNSHQEQSEPIQIQILQLDAVSFEPRWKQRSYTNLGVEEHDSRFGLIRLTHFRIDDRTESGDSSHFWCDSTSVIFDYVAPDGGGYKLVAVNFTV